MGKLTYQQEEDNLLYTILDKRFFSVWKNPSTSPVWKLTNLELYITSSCNLACEYCYLRMHEDKLYPVESRKESMIKSNLIKIFDWWLDNDFSIHELNLFSGEIWHLPFGMWVLETILSYVKKGMKLECIMVPTNSTFALEQETLNKMQEIVDQFRSAGCVLIISHSIEGLILEDISRPMKSTNKLRDEKFYDNIFTFAKKNNFYFHPMVAAANIEQWRENYDWFADMCAKYDMPFPRSVMMLEVRNPDWTPEKIEHLKAYYKHQIDYFWQLSGQNHDRFMANAFGIGMNDSDGGYSNISFAPAKTQAPCTIDFDMTIRVGDLTIMPCHRTSYPQFAYGKFKLQYDKLAGIEAINPQIATKMLFSNHFTSIHGCDVCAYKGICMRQCFGEQYESTDEIFMPDPIVCNMFKAKYNFLIDTYDQMGLLRHMSQIPASDTRYIITQQILMEIDRINRSRGGADTNV